MSSVILVEAYSMAQVLTTGSWPLATPAMCALPPELDAPSKAFEEFYHSKHGGRQLKWHTGIGTADMRATIQGRRVSLSVTTHQMVVLMLFNHSPSLKFSEIKQATSITPDELRPALIGLSLVKGKALLRKTPAGRDIADDDAFAFNERFESKLMKLKFSSAGGPKEVDIDRGTRQKVEEDRRHILEATIVRVMKARRVADYNAIVAEVTRQCAPRFAPAAADVKRRIESLIERDFLERDGEDRRLYRYLA